MDLGPINPALGVVIGGVSLSRVTGSASAPGHPAVELAEALGDFAATLLTDLSAPDIDKLIDLIEGPLPDQDAAQLQNLQATFLSAAAEGDAALALGALGEIVALDPSRSDMLRASPAIEPIRVDVEQFLNRCANLARLDASGRLEQATHQAGTAERIAGWEMRPATMVQLAYRVFDAGGLANYMNAAELAQIVLNASQWVPSTADMAVGTTQAQRMKLPNDAPRPAGTASRALRRAIGTMSARLRSVWRRAPLLILLLSWLLLGVVIGCGSLVWHRFGPDTWPGLVVEMAFQAWGLGFLALVALGFLAQLRKARL